MDPPQIEPAYLENEDDVSCIRQGNFFISLIQLIWLISSFHIISRHFHFVIKIQRLSWENKNRYKKWKKLAFPQL